MKKHDLVIAAALACEAALHMACMADAAGQHERAAILRDDAECESDSAFFWLTVL